MQRRVKFPLEYDASDVTTDTLRAKLLPVSRRLLELEKERAERAKVRRRTAAGEQCVRGPEAEREARYGEREDERGGEGGEDRAHARAEEHSGGLDAHLCVVGAILARVDGIVEYRPTVEFEVG